MLREGSGNAPRAFRDFCVAPSAPPPHVLACASERLSGLGSTSDEFSRGGCVDSTVNGVETHSACLRLVESVSVSMRYFHAKRSCSMPNQLISLRVQAVRTHAKEQSQGVGARSDHTLALGSQAESRLGLLVQCS